MQMGDIHLNLDIHVRYDKDPQWLPLGGAGTAVSAQPSPKGGMETVLTSETEALPDHSRIRRVTSRIVYIPVLNHSDLVLNYE